MIRKIFVAVLFLFVVAPICLGQSDIKIKKKIKFIIPEMASMPDNMPQKAKDMLTDAMNRTADVYLKGARMRTDTPYKVPSKTGGMKTRIQTTIFQCDRQQTIQFNDKKKKYYVEDSEADTKAKKGGFVTVSLSVTDTGERMKLFGYDSRRIKQKITVTPGANACQKSAFQMDVDGWYAEIPSFSCPIKSDITEMQTQKGCFDDVVFEMKGDMVSGFAVKEIKTMTTDGKTITIEEEIIELANTTLDAALFEPPAEYKPANTKAEVAKDDDAQTSQTETVSPTPAAENQTISNAPAPTLAPPVAGVVSEIPLQPKKAGVIRVGIAKPTVKTPDKDNDGGQTELANAIGSSLFESLKAEKVEAVRLSTDAPESEARQKECDYIFYASVMQKRGGGMFGKMIAMGAMSAVGGFIPGVGGMVASTVGSIALQQTMGKTAKAKDEFTFDYKVVGLDNAVLTQAVTKAKTKTDGEDVLTPQIKQASIVVLGEIAKKK